MVSGKTRWKKREKVPLTLATTTTRQKTRKFSIAHTSKSWWMWKALKAKFANCSEVQREKFILDKSETSIAIKMGSRVANFARFRKQFRIFDNEMNGFRPIFNEVLTATAYPYHLHLA
eukprot:gene4915-5563_t